MLLHISQNTVGSNFRSLQPGVDTIGKFDQFLSMTTGKWTPSTYSKSEGYKNERMIAHYRRAANWKGVLEILWTLIKKYWNKLF